MMLSLDIMDPQYHFDNMKDLPKYMIFSSNDEFMMSDWPNSYIDKIQGEFHIYVVPNTDHSLATGYYSILGSIGAFIRSCNKNNKESAHRPSFQYHLDNTDGEITIKIPRTS